MPMNNEVRVPLLRVLTALRHDWTDAEVGDATRVLAEQTADPFTLTLQAIAQARKGSNVRAVSITWPLEAEAVVRTLTARLPEQSRCLTHHNDRVDAVTGEFVCCLQEKAGDSAPPSPFVRTGTSTPPPGLRALIEQDIERKKATK